MRLTSQNLPDVEDVSESLIQQAFDEKAIGRFAHLWKSDAVFIQAAGRGTPSNCAPPDDPLVVELREFIDRHGSEPWTLEYSDAVIRKEYRVRGNLTLEQVKGAFVSYLRSDGEWRQDHEWEELKTGRYRFPDPKPDEHFELVESIPNARLTLDLLPPSDADGAQVWQFADTFNGFRHWGTIDRCAEIANEKRCSTLTELRTCLFFECRRWHYFGELPDEHETPYIRSLLEKVGQMVADGRFE